MLSRATLFSHNIRPVPMGGSNRRVYDNVFVFEYKGNTETAWNTSEGNENFSFRKYF